MRDTIETERLVLRQLRLTDAPALSEYGSDFDVARMTGSFPHPFPILSAEFKIAHMRASRRQGLAYPYAITREGGPMIGIADLFRRKADDDLELGYWVGRPFWGTGLATEAAKALIARAREVLRVEKIVAGVFADNLGSMRVLEKLGFARNGEDDDYFSMARLSNAPSLGYELDLQSLAKCDQAT